MKNVIRKLFKPKPPESSQLFPSDFTDAEKSNIKSVQPFTMTSPERLVALSRAIDHIENHKIPGDIVECGVWRGGSIMLAARRLLQHNSSQRNLFLFDTFEGMTPPTEKDRSLEGVSAKHLLETSQPTDESLLWCIARIDDVRKNVGSTGYDQSLIHLIQGPVEKTLPHQNIGKIAILRLDTDWYESTSHELNTLYDNVVPGGFIIIDDYGHWEGCRKAVDEFFAGRNLKVFLHRIDYTGRILVKP